MHDKLERTPQRRAGMSALVRALPVLTGALVMALGLTLGTAAQAAGAPSDTPKQAATISALSISGNSAFSSSQLERAMGISASHWYARGDDYSKARLASALTNLRIFYLSHGYLKFLVKEITTAPSPDGKTVAIRIVVSEGPLYTLGSIELSGNVGNLANTPGMTEALQRALPIGKPVTREGLEAARRAIIAQLGHQGYAQARVSPRFTTDDKNARIALIFEVTHGRQLTQTSPVREGGVTPLTPIPKQPSATSAAPPPKAEPTAPPPKTEPAAKPPQTQPSGTQPAPSKPQQAKQPLDLADQREITLGASAGYSSADRIIAMARARYLDAFGKGWDLTGDLAAGKTYRAARLSESDRWFTPGGTSRSTSLWYRADQPFYYLNRSHFRTSGTGLTERFDIPITAADNIYVAPGIEHDWLGADSLTPQAYLNYMQRFGSMLNIGTLRAGWAHDMRDSASLPTRGYIVQGDAEFGFGTATYLKAYMSGSYYHPLWGSTVLSLSGLGGFGQGFGSQGYPIEKYLYAGGIGSVRGYAGNSLGPRDRGTGFPLGGRRLLVGSIEADTPLPSPFKSDLPGRPVWLLFVDGGNVWSDGLGGTSAGPARFSYGTGLGWQIPYGMLKLSFALPVKRYSGDDYQKFQVEFNASF
jgi:outer membrane protein insertion porin family